MLQSLHSTNSPLLPSSSPSSYLLHYQKKQTEKGSQFKIDDQTLELAAKVDRLWIAADVMTAQGQFSRNAGNISGKTQEQALVKASGKTEQALHDSAAAVGLLWCVGILASINLEDLSMTVGVDGHIRTYRAPTARDHEIFGFSVSESDETVE